MAARSPTCIISPIPPMRTLPDTDPDLIAEDVR
jgi:hypothetical protein